MGTIVLGAADCSHHDIHISDGLTLSMTSPDFSAIPLIYAVFMVKLRPFSSRVIAFGTRPAIQQPRWPSRHGAPGKEQVGVIPQAPIRRQRGECHGTQ